MKEILNDLIEYKSLTKDNARQVLMELASGKYNNSQMAAFMTVYMMRNITIDELQGFRDAMLELCVRVEFDQPVMDLCGTGGDGKNTFNISTLASFIVAAAGQPVAKHGNYGVSSVCGSSNLLAYFGHEFTNNVDELKRSLESCNMCFMHAPLFHPAMKNVGPIRKELGVKTFFNMLGPMVNPAFPKRQMVGVFSLELARQYGYLYQATDTRFLILHALDGYDEVSLTGDVKTYTQSGEGLVTPSDFAMDVVQPAEIVGGTTVEDSAKIFQAVLEGEGTPAHRNVAIANAALALHAADASLDLHTTTGLAAEALDSGKALKTFRKFLKK